MYGSSKISTHTYQVGGKSDMRKIRKLRCVILVALILAGSLFVSSCSVSNRAADPGLWGYDCKVVYDALGGIINAREVRETFYMKNSYVFKPSGTINLLIEPVKDGYILAGWYTAKEDILDENGNVIGYKFKAEDRWDFDEDRVQEDMTLYARWIPQGRVQYVDAITGEVKFSKNITADSPVQKLSSAAETLISKQGHTLYGYFADKECTIPYDFTEYVHKDLIPTNEEIYAKLYEEFPEYITRIEFVPPTEEELNSQFDTSDLFFNKLGYDIVDDQEARARIRARKDELYEEAINYYVANTANKVVYLKYIEGNYLVIGSPDDIKQGGKYSFSGLDRYGKPVDGYILSNDIDFNGAVVDMTESFSGKIYGNGYSLKNMKINVSSKKIDGDTSKSVGLFKNLKGAYIDNLTIENLSITLSVNSGIEVTVGALAVNAENSELRNVHFKGLTIDTGKGDDGKASYKISDLFASQRNTKLDNVTGTDITIKASEFAQVVSQLGQ